MGKNRQVMDCGDLDAKALLSYERGTPVVDQPQGYLAHKKLPDERSTPVFRSTS